MLPQFDAQFWSSFWPVFFSSLIVVVFLSGFISWFFNYIRRPKLRICLSVLHGTRNRQSLSFYCVNDGNIGVMPQEMRWHIYFTVYLKPKDEYVTGFSMITDNGTPLVHLSGSNDEPCLPSSSLMLTTVPIDVIKSEFDYDFIIDAPFYYSITTKYGQKGNSFWDKLVGRKFIEDNEFVERRAIEINEEDKVT